MSEGGQRAHLQVDVAHRVGDLDRLPQVGDPGRHVAAEDRPQPAQHVQHAAPQQRVVAGVVQRAPQQRLAGLEVVVLELRPQDQRLGPGGTGRQPRDQPVGDLERAAHLARRRQVADLCERTAPRRLRVAARRQPHGVGRELGRPRRGAPPSGAIGARLQQRGGLGVGLVRRQGQVARRARRRPPRPPPATRAGPAAAAPGDGRRPPSRSAGARSGRADRRRPAGAPRAPPPRAPPRAPAPGASGPGRASTSAPPRRRCRAASRGPAAGRPAAARWRRAARSAAPGRRPRSPGPAPPGRGPARGRRAGCRPRPRGCAAAPAAGSPFPPAAGAAPPARAAPPRAPPSRRARMRRQGSTGSSSPRRRTHRREQADRLRLQAPQREAERAGGRGIEPLQVVDGHHHRSRRGERAERRQRGAPAAEPASSGSSDATSSSRSPSRSVSPPRPIARSSAAGRATSTWRPSVRSPTTAARQRAVLPIPDAPRRTNPLGPSSRRAAYASSSARSRSRPTRGWAASTGRAARPRGEYRHARAGHGPPDGEAGAAHRRTLVVSDEE